MNVGFPWRIDGRGHSATVDEATWVRGLIEQVLFTAPGERVMRPDFGSGVMQLVFAPNSMALAATTEMLVQGALQRWLSDLIVVEALSVAAEDSTLRITLQYVLRTSQVREVQTFERAIPQ